MTQANEVQTNHSEASLKKEKGNYVTRYQEQRPFVVSWQHLKKSPGSSVYTASNHSYIILATSEKNARDRVYRRCGLTKEQWDADETLGTIDVQPAPERALCDLNFYWYQM